MNKNIIQIGSLCIVILLLMGILYVTRTNEGFVAPPATQDPELLTKAKQAVGTATAAVTAATRAVGTPAETSIAKDAYSKATLAVTAANSAVTDTMGALKVVLGLQDVADPSMATINEKITALDGFAATAKNTWEAAERAKAAKNPAEKKRLSDVAAADRDTKKRAWEALPN